MRLLKILALVLIISSITGCMSSSGKRPPVVIPPGVDSLVAAISDSLVDSLFVSPERVKKADELTKQGRQKFDRSDSLWNLIESKRDSQKTITQADLARAQENKQKGAGKVQKIVELQTGEIDSVNKQIIRNEVFNLLTESQKLFEASLIDNPFDEETKIWLAQVYEMMASRFQNSKNYEKAVQVLKSMIRMNRGEPRLYFRLGMNYWFLKEWQKAYENFKQAENILLAITPLNVEADSVQSANELKLKMDSVPVDTSHLFQIIYFQADTKAKLYEADTALALLNRALQIAPSPTEEKDILFYINWIKWDDGNIRASELRDYYIKLEANNQYEEAAKGFKKLLKVLKTERTADQINWRISLLEFERLNQHKNGIARLAEVISKTPKDSNGAPIDSSYRRYFKDYGVMGYNMGMRNLIERPKVAFMYFKQSVTIDCPSRGKSYLELARLSANNPKESVQMCHQALQYAADLSDKEKSQAYRLLVQGYKRQGQIDKAKEYFVKWKLLDSKTHKNGE